MTKWVALLLLLLSKPATAGENLDVKDWLSRPGVKMLAVEFYASWCGPCKTAVPRWKELHEKYRDKGLRLVVVSVQDPNGSCVNPGWNPDDVICDDEAHLAEAWQVGEKLPAAFLWSWRGTLLVRKGHVDEVERAVEAELGRLPRVTLDPEMDAGVREMLRSELARTGKVDVVAGEEERKALEEIQKTSHDLKFSEQSSCRLGEQLAANSLLKASFVKAGKGKRLLVQLFSAETGCLNASAGVFWNEENSELSIAEAVAELINNLRVAVEVPGDRTPVQVDEQEIGEREEDWNLTGTRGVIVSFETEPAGALVAMDGKTLCQSTPCSKLVSMGPHRVQFQMEGYVSARESLSVTGSTTRIRRTLAPDFGWLTVRSNPTGLTVTLDGKPLGTTPVDEVKVSSGPHQVLVTSPTYFDKGKQLVIERGEHEVVSVDLKPRQGGLEVLARDERGNDLAAQVELDGRVVGRTPWFGKVMIGTHALRVAHQDATYDRDLAVEERETVTVTARLDLSEERRRHEAQAKAEAERKREKNAARNELSWGGLGHPSTWSWIPGGRELTLFLPPLRWTMSGDKKAYHESFRKPWAWHYLSSGEGFLWQLGAMLIEGVTVGGGFVAGFSDGNRGILGLGIVMLVGGYVSLPLLDRYVEGVATERYLDAKKGGVSVRGKKGRGFSFMLLPVLEQDAIGASLVIW